MREYLKGEGPDTIRVALKVESGPRPDRPLVRAEHAQNVREGLEYVLFLRGRSFPTDWGLSGRTWAILGGAQGRWPVVGGDFPDTLCTSLGRDGIGRTSGGHFTLANCAPARDGARPVDDSGFKVGGHANGRLWAGCLGTVCGGECCRVFWHAGFSAGVQSNRHSCSDGFPAGTRINSHR